MHKSLKIWEGKQENYLLFGLKIVGVEVMRHWSWEMGTMDAPAGQCANYRPIGLDLLLQ
jgi:hypothetical protein